MVLPQITYTDSVGLVNFVPQYPPKGKLAVDALEATRHDSITSAGQKQSVVEHVDNMNAFDFPFVPASDVASWQRFMSFALGGGLFTWYPDSTNLNAFEQYTIEDMGWTPKFASPGWYTFSFKVRKAIL